MNPKRVVRCHSVSGLMALCLFVAAPRVLEGQSPATPAMAATAAGDAAGFKEFSDRVQVYLKLQKAVESSLPALKPTDLPELIAAYQQALARRIQEARPNAKAGNLFTPPASAAFRRASRAALEGPDTASRRASMQDGAPDPGMWLAVNGIYPDTEPNTTVSPALLAAYPLLPDVLAYRVVGRHLIVMDVKSRLVVDVARLILPPA